MSTSILLAGIFLLIVLLALAARLLNCKHFFLCVVCVFVCAKWDCGPQAFLADTMETGDKTKAMHKMESCERCRAFPEQVSPRILSLESVDYSGTNDYFSGEKKNNLNMQNFDGQANWSGV